MRVYLCILAGITSALIGWNIGQFVLSDLSQAFPILQFFKQFSEIVLFPAVAASLATGLVLNEIFLSNPTRLKANFKIAFLPVTIAAGLGILSGLIAGVLVQILFLPQIHTPASLVRVLGWLCIGSTVGFAEGWTWRWRSIEAGNRKRFHQRLRNSIIFGSLASLAAAFLFEVIRKSFGEFPSTFAGLEDPLGFSILGALLGIAFSITSSPSYMVALRAGAGFEYTEYAGLDSVSPRIETKHLKFVTDSEAEQIEEGLSIQLPANGKLTIGSGPEDHIFIPGLRPAVAQLELKPRETTLIATTPLEDIAINGEALTSRRKILKHNYVLTFYSTDAAKSYGKEFFRFVYYNRFLDPQA